MPLRHVMIDFELDTDDPADDVPFAFRIIENAIAHGGYTRVIDARITIPIPTRQQLQDELARRSAIIMRD